MRGCPACGFDASSVSVDDAIVTLRSLPRRWRAALASVDGDDTDVLRRRPEDGSPSASEHLSAAELALGGGELAAAAERVAAEAARRDADEWKDELLLDRLRDAAHAGVHHLKAAQQALRQVRGRH